MVREKESRESIAQQGVDTRTKMKMKNENENEK
jgi:hypothetical protein